MPTRHLVAKRLPCKLPWQFPQQRSKGVQVMLMQSRHLDILGALPAVILNRSDADTCHQKQPCNPAKSNYPTQAADDESRPPSGIASSFPLASAKALAFSTGNLAAS